MSTVIRFDSNVTNILERDFFIDKTHQEEEIKSINNNEPIHFLPHDCKINNLAPSELTMIGVTPSGTKTSVRVTNCEFYIDVMCRAMTKKSKQTCLSGFLDDVGHNNVRKLSEEMKRKCINTIDGAMDFSKACRVISRSNEVNEMYPICAKIYNVGYLRHPEIFGYRMTFKKVKERDIIMKDLYKNDLLYVVSNCTKADLINTIFPKADIYSGYWIDLNKYKCTYEDRDDQFNYEATYSEMTDPRGLTKAKFCFIVNFSDISMTPEDETKGEPTLLCGMDIETCLVANIEEMEKVGKNIIDPHNQIFNISMVFRMNNIWKSVNIFYTKDGKYHEECCPDEGINVVCTSEKDLLLAMTLCWERTQPDFVSTYNGNRFDIPMILMKARIHNIACEMICRLSCAYDDSINRDHYEDINGTRYYHSKNSYNGTVYSKWTDINTSPSVSGLSSSTSISNNLNLKAQQQEKKFKVENGSDMHYSLWCPFGCMVVDMYLYCIKTYVKEHDKSMNAFLKKNKIPTKLDVSYADIWKYWKSNNFEKLKDVFVYCEYDSKAVILLMDALLYMPIMRKMSELTSLPIKQIIYKADGIKAACLTYKYASRMNMLCIENLLNRSQYSHYEHLFDHVVKEKLSNRGALVLVHMRGKISLWYKVKSSNKHGIDYIRSKGFEVKEEDGFIWVLVIMPVEAYDFSSLYPSIETVFNYSTDTMTQSKCEINEKEFHTFEHEELPDFYKKFNTKIYSKKHGGDRSKFGVIPRYLQDMKDERNAIKAEMGSLKSKRIELERSLPVGTDFVTIKEWNILVSQWKVLDGKQRALKVAMNTVYGSTSYCNSTIYNYLIAFLTTYYGREYLLKQNKYLEDRGCTLVYNDTDSTYAYHPISLFEDIIDRYLNGEIEERDYDRKMVLRSMKNSFTKKQILSYYRAKTRKSMEKELVHATGSGKLDLETKLKNLTDERNDKLLKTIEEISDPNYRTFVDKLNDYYEKDTGSKYLVSVREETMLPFIVGQLKRYFGLAYEDGYHEFVDLGHILFRGFSLRKRDASKFLNNFVGTVVMEIVKTKKTNISEITLNKLDSYYDELEKTGKLAGEYEYFQQTKRYKPTIKANDAYGVVRSTLHYGSISDDPEIKLLCQEPDPLDYVSYVKMAPLSYRKLNLNKYDSSKRTCYLLTEVAKKSPHKMDFISIIETLHSTCATLIAYEERFKYTDEEFEYADSRGALVQFEKDAAKESTTKARAYLTDRYKEKTKLIDPVIIMHEKMEKFSRKLKISKKNLYVNWMRHYYKGDALSILELFCNYGPSPSSAFINIAETSEIQVSSLMRELNSKGIEDLTKKKDRLIMKIESYSEFLQSMVRILIDTLNKTMMENMNGEITFEKLGNPLSVDQLIKLAEYHRDLTIYCHQNRLLKELSIEENNTEGISLGVI